MSSQSLHPPEYRTGPSHHHPVPVVSKELEIFFPESYINIEDRILSRCSTCDAPHQLERQANTLTFDICSIPYAPTLVRRLTSFIQRREFSQKARCLHETNGASFKQPISHEDKKNGSVTIMRSPKNYLYSQSYQQINQPRLGGLEISMGATLQWLELFQIMKHAIGDPRYSSFPLYRSGFDFSPNHYGFSEFHSSIMMLVLNPASQSSRKCILRELSLVNLAKSCTPWVNKQDGINDFHFCIHQNANRIHAFLQSVTSSSVAFEFQELFIDCQICGIEVIVRCYHHEFDLATGNAGIFIWRYVNLGNLSTSESPQWKKLTQLDESSPISIDSLKQNPSMLPIFSRSVGRQGPLSKAWCKRLGLKQQSAHCATAPTGMKKLLDWIDRKLA
jgi:hypothetical protein